MNGVDSWVFFNGDFKKYSEVHLGLLTHALHYGTGCFEGLRAYWNETLEQLYLVQPEQHYDRLHRSVKLLGLDLKYSSSELVDATIKILRRNLWHTTVYVRPIFFCSTETIGIRLHNLETSLAIVSVPMERYLVEGPLKVNTSSWRRNPDVCIPSRGKITGSYVNAALAKSEAYRRGNDEAIMLTIDGSVAEGSSCNLFMVRGDTLITPPITEDILEGITRSCLMIMARDLGISVSERKIDRSELYSADEVFLCGTGVEISPVGQIDGRSLSPCPGPITSRLQQTYFDMVHGLAYKDWTVPVYIFNHS